MQTVNVSPSHQPGTPKTLDQSLRLSRPRSLLQSLHKSFLHAGWDTEQQDIRMGCMIVEGTHSSLFWSSPLCVPCVSAYRSSLQHVYDSGCLVAQLTTLCCSAVKFLRCIPSTCITLALCTQKKTMHYLIGYRTIFCPPFSQFCLLSNCFWLGSHLLLSTFTTCSAVMCPDCDAGHSSIWSVCTWWVCCSRVLLKPLGIFSKCLAHSDFSSSWLLRPISCYNSEVSAAVGFLMCTTQTQCAFKLQRLFWVSFASLVYVCGPCSELLQFK